MFCQVKKQKKVEFPLLRTNLVYQYHPIPNLQTPPFLHHFYIHGLHF